MRVLEEYKGSVRGNNMTRRVNENGGNRMESVRVYESTFKTLKCSQTISILFPLHSPFCTFDSIVYPIG